MSLSQKEKGRKRAISLTFPLFKRPVSPSPARGLLRLPGARLIIAVNFSSSHIFFFCSIQESRIGRRGNHFAFDKNVDESLKTFLFGLKILQAGDAPNGHLMVVARILGRLLARLVCGVSIVRIGLNRLFERRCESRASRQNDEKPDREGSRMESFHSSSFWTVLSESGGLHTVESRKSSKFETIFKNEMISQIGQLCKSNRKTKFNAF